LAELNNIQQSSLNYRYSLIFAKRIGFRINSLMVPRILGLIPPMTQLNTPYPSTAYLTGFLRSRNIEAYQDDIALALVLSLFSRSGLEAVMTQASSIAKDKRSATVQWFIEAFDLYFTTIGPVIGFLQGRDPTLAHRICARNFLPEGPRFDSLDQYVDDPEASDSGTDPLAWAFGALGIQDRARHFATLYMNDLADVVRDAIDSRFEFVRYAESLAGSQASFDPLAAALGAQKNLVDETLAELTIASVKKHQPNIVLLSVPFPGAVYGALRMAQTIKQLDSTIVVCLGGGYVNTELRELAEPRLFDYVDYVMLDSGEKPLLALLEHLQGLRPRLNLVRTFVRVDGTVRYFKSNEADVPFNEVGTPTWDGLKRDQYLSFLDMLNPMHRLWSDGCWNKITVAHGCYWKKCSFCDVSLDYIARYEAASAVVLVDRIEAIINETGQTGFHLVDEAAPPKALRAMAEELARRKLSITWWGNIRFEKSFTPELAQLLADSGCIAISGGLEVASDRLLNLMKKGVSVDQVARVTRALSDAGILVHAYLMYGFPTQTEHETIDALEYVRQLFAQGCIQSGFFHRFACTVHSPVGMNPAEYGITLAPQTPGLFAKNDIGFTDPTPANHDMLGKALNKALYNYMHGIELDRDVREWFAEFMDLNDGQSMRIPKPRVARNFVERALA
jgi:Radical SAM superfamily